jgi:signal transduction histidine kinase
VLALTGLLIIVGYYYARLSLGPQHWGPELLMILPPALAMRLLLRRGEHAHEGGLGGRAASFWRLIGIGAGLWMSGQVLWTLAVARGLSPVGTSEVDLGYLVPLDTLFIGFLVPMVGAVALRAHPPEYRRGDVAWTDAGLLVVAVAFVFARLVVLPRHGSFSARGLVLAALCFVLAEAGAVLLALVEDPEWKRPYGLIALFAVLYGGFSAIANGSGGPMLPPGGPLDLAWMVPFFVLAAAALPPISQRRWPASWAILLAGPGPFVVDMLLDVALPQAAGAGHAAHLALLLPTSGLLAIGSVLRLWAQEEAETQALEQWRLRAEEGQRAGRLATLAALSASVIDELRMVTGEVVARARGASAALGESAARALAQAERAQRIVRDLAGALRLVRSGPRRELDLGVVVEEAIDAALGGGLALQVSLEGMGTLPPVVGDAAGLRLAVHHLLKNAAQACPGGLLQVRGEACGREVVLRFLDEGPGVAPEARARMFDPFFTTRRVGEGVGLGLTLVHFVARDHGGSVVLEPSPRGACFALRLAVAPQPGALSPAEWSLGASALAAAASATFVAVLQEPQAQLAGAVLRITAALVAAAALARMAWLSRGRERVFWSTLTAGPFLVASGRILGFAGLWSHAQMLSTSVAADLCWVVALPATARPRGGRAAAPAEPPRRRGGAVPDHLRAALLGRAPRDPRRLRSGHPPGGAGGAEPPAVRPRAVDGLPARLGLGTLLAADLRPAHGGVHPVGHRPHPRRVGGDPASARLREPRERWMDRALPADGRAGGERLAGAAPGERRPLAGPRLSAARRGGPGRAGGDPGVPRPLRRRLRAPGPRCRAGAPHRRRGAGRRPAARRPGDPGPS